MCTHRCMRRRFPCRTPTASGPESEARNLDSLIKSALDPESEIFPVTVVVPTYHRPAALVECIRSIFAGDRQPTEIIVVGHADDAPTKEMLGRVQELCGSKATVRTGWVTKSGHL